ncbi:MAG TPA: FliH/SctL family protein [Gammaproteobacteria bacterium]|nr:FliH/SctL family protein [Gammaproteobacteria bacterium]
MNTDRILRGVEVSAASRPLPLAEAPLDSSPVPEQPARPDREELKQLFADELAALANEARTDGRKDGIRDAEKKAAEQLTALRNELDEAHQARMAELEAFATKLQTMIDAVRQERSACAREAEALAVEIASAATLKMLGESAQSRTLLPRLVHAALRELDPAQSLRIRISPADHAGLPTSLTDGLPKDIELIADAKLTPASCVVDHRRGHLDASLLTQLDAFRETLLDTYQLEEPLE